MRWCGLRGAVVSLTLFAGTLGCARCAAGACLWTTVTADSLYADYLAYKVLDGNTTDESSRWASAKTADPHWVRFQFSTPVTLDRVIIYGQPEPYALLDAELQVFEDGAWTPIWLVTDSNQARVDARFAARTISDIRLYITRASQGNPPYGYAARIYELAFLFGDVHIPALASELGIAAPARPTPPEPGGRRGDPAGVRAGVSCATARSASRRCGRHDGVLRLRVELGRHSRATPGERPMSAGLELLRPGR